MFLLVDRVKNVAHICLRELSSSDNIGWNHTSTCLCDYFCTTLYLNQCYQV